MYFFEGLFQSEFVRQAQKAVCNGCSAKKPHNKSAASSRPKQVCIFSLVSGVLGIEVGPSGHPVVSGIFERTGITVTLCVESGRNRQSGIHQRTP